MRLLTVIGLALMLAIVLLIGNFLGFVPLPWPEKHGTLEEVQVEYLAAIMTSDCVVQGEDPEVCKEVGRTALRFRADNGKSPEQIFKGGLTLVPLGYKRGIYLRWLRYVRGEAPDWQAVLDAAHEIDKEANGKKPPGCATHYIRASRRTDDYAQPDDAKATLKSTMKSVGRYKKLGVTEFLCPIH